MIDAKTRLMARAILEHPAVRASVQQRLIEGTLPEDIELRLWEIAYDPAPARAPTLVALSADELTECRAAAVWDGDPDRVAVLNRKLEAINE